MNTYSDVSYHFSFSSWCTCYSGRSDRSLEITTSYYIILYGNVTIKNLKEPFGWVSEQDVSFRINSFKFLTEKKMNTTEVKKNKV